MGREQKIARPEWNPAFGALRSYGNACYAGYVDHLPKLEDLCVKFIRANVNCWKPEDFLEAGAKLKRIPTQKQHEVVKGIPRHLLFPLLEKLHPLEIEKLEVSGVFQTMGIDTDPLWRDIYTAHWPRKSKWPEVYFKTKRIRREQEQWRVYYLQRHLQEALNSSGAAKRSESLQNIVSVCGRYAAYLRLYNPACIYLAKNWDIVLQLAEYVEFIEVFLLRDNGVDSLCHLLQAFASKRLKSIGFCFCKVNNVDMWSEIIGSLSQVSHQKGRSITGREKNVIEVSTGDNYHDKSHINQMCSTASNGTPHVPFDERMNKNDSCTSRQNILDDLDIYEFADGSDNHFSLSRTDEKGTEVRRKSDGCLHQAVSSEISAGVSSDLYDEVFSSSEAPKELCDINQEPQQTGSTPEKCQIIPESLKMKSQLNRLSYLGCSLIHFELVAFWLHQDLLELFVHSLKSWLNLESLTLEDNGLGLLHPSSSLKLMDTLFFLCTQGQLQKFKITNNLVTDDVAKFLIEKLVGSFCDKCNQNSKSLRKLKFSSSQVSEAFSAYLGKAIRDVCFCKSSNHSYSAEMLDPVSISSTSKSKTPDGVDLTQADCNKDLTQADFVVQQTCSCCVCFPVLCNNYCLERRKAEYTKAASGHKNVCYDSTRTTNNPESHGTCCEEMPAVDSSQDLSHRPLSFTACDASVFGIKELRVTCPICDGGASLIADGLRRNNSLHSLSLVKCNISTSGLADIFKALTGNRCLKHLSVKGNSYDLGNNDSLAEMLASNDTLTDLDLGSCKLGEHVTELGTAIIYALCINSTLTSLKLEKNRLGDAHIASLSQVFSHPSQVSRIIKLDLSNNPISLECLSDFASSLQCIRPRKLDELRLTGNILGSKQHQVLSSLRSVVRSVIAEHLDKATLFADFISQM